MLKRNGNYGNAASNSMNAQYTLRWQEFWRARKCIEAHSSSVLIRINRYDDNRVMEFVLMKLAFPPEARDYPSPSSQVLSFSPETHCCSPSKSPANSPPPSSRSSPQDSTLHISSTITDSAYPTRSPLSVRTTSPPPDCTECYRETLTHTVCPCMASSTYQTCYEGRSTGAGGLLRAELLFESTSQPTLEPKPIFFPLTSFHTTGVVMNVFLLDPPRRLLSAFVWVASSNTIGEKLKERNSGPHADRTLGLYVLLDWAKDEYIFVDTGVGCVSATCSLSSYATVHPLKHIYRGISDMQNISLAYIFELVVHLTRGPNSHSLRRSRRCIPTLLSSQHSPQLYQTSQTQPAHDSHPQP